LFGSGLEQEALLATTSERVIVRRRIHVCGIVQGVGFRPFVYNTALKLGITGFVLNSSSGVTVEAEAAGQELDRFVEDLRSKAPPLAVIEELTFEDFPAIGESGFVIRESVPEAGKFVLISPDIAACEDCWHDSLDPTNRRYGYPFTNCTNCGPRYTIIQDIPYDRPSTTMSGFRMCPQCQGEYDDPGNRRFHAQPNACAKCGPGIALAKGGSFMPEGPAYRFGNLSLSILRDVRNVLRAGGVAAVKGLGGYHLACDAANEEAVRLLRSRKKRSDKPFALMARDVAAVGRFCRISPADRELLLSPQHPIVVLSRREDAALSREIAPGNKTLGVMLPYTPMQWFLFGEDPNAEPEFAALVMTSGNISDEPIVTSNGEAWQKLRSVADWFLFHNRGIHMRVDDSLARTFEGKPRVLRRSRGYAPLPIDLKRQMVELLACGAELKNTFCLTKGSYAIPSQHIGDVDNYETLEFFKETVENLKKLFRVQPKAVAYDLHPLYLTSRFAGDMRDVEKVGVQHHHAHIASCMAENDVDGKVIGVAFDGTGYGTDGQIWGGEFLVANYLSFERRAHIRYVPMPGGDAAVRNTWRAGLSWLRATFGSKVPEDLDLFRHAGVRQLVIVSTMIERNLNTVQTSSCGRLFDAVASIVGLRHEATYEGQAAVELESVTESGVEDRYPYDIEEAESVLLDMRSTIEAIVKDVREGRSSAWIASCFHNTIASAIVEICRRIRRSDALSRVCLSGGTFQNMYLLERTLPMLRSEGFEVFLHSKVPPNDGGISLGQAAIANEILSKKG
jgi:hydrogenase maturation protein HypF